MSIESSPKNSYESLVRASDGELIKESQKKEYERGLESNIKDVPEVDHEEKIDKGRRKFLVGLGSAAVATSTGGRVLNKIYTKETPENRQEKLVKKVEKEPVYVAPIDQFIEFGELRNLSTALDTVYENHFEYLTQTTRGRKDMLDAVVRLSTLENKDEFIAPFKKWDVPEQFCYMIAIQETRAQKDAVSWAGATGIMGIMEGTAEQFGYSLNDMKDPVKASDVCAQYLMKSQEMYGKEDDMLLHSYNGGWYMFQFWKHFPKGERTKENFYTYMEESMNQKYTESRERGYFVHDVKKGDNITTISEIWHTDLEDILEKNNLNKESVIKVGKKIKIPVSTNPDTLKHFFRKELEVLKYAPEVKAKYAALIEHGFVA